MALWGNNDAVGSGGTVSLNYGTGVVTGSGTTFGQTGAAKLVISSDLVSAMAPSLVMLPLFLLLVLNL